MATHVTRRRALAATGAFAATGLAGCSGDGDPTATPVPDFAIAEFLFATEQPDSFGNVEEQPEATYAPEDVVWIYLDVVGFDIEDAGDNEIRVRITEDLTVEAANGETAIDDTLEFDERISADLREQFFVTNNLTFPAGVPTGEYEVDVGLTDEIGGATTSRTGTFRLE